MEFLFGRSYFSIIAFLIGVEVQVTPRVQSNPSNVNVNQRNSTPTPPHSESTQSRSLPEFISPEICHVYDQGTFWVDLPATVSLKASLKEWWSISAGFIDANGQVMTCAVFESSSNDAYVEFYNGGCEGTVEKYTALPQEIKVNDWFHLQWDNNPMLKVFLIHRDNKDLLFETSSNDSSSDLKLFVQRLEVLEIKFNCPSNCTIETSGQSNELRFFKKVYQNPLVIEVKPESPETQIQFQLITETCDGIEVNTCSMNQTFPSTKANLWSNVKIHYNQDNVVTMEVNSQMQVSHLVGPANCGSFSAFTIHVKGLASFRLNCDMSFPEGHYYLIAVITVFVMGELVYSVMLFVIVNRQLE